MHRHAKFDLARRMTSLAVLLTHVFQVFWRRFFTIDDPYRYAASTIARHSVLIFFLLSGYLIALSIFGNRERHSRFDVAEYATTRAARIWPPLLGSVFVVLICYALITYLHLPGGSTPYGVAGDQSVAREVFTVSYAEIISSLLLLGGLGTANAPLWSLYFEAWLYVAAALLALAFFSGSMIFRIASSVSAAIFFVILVSIKHTFLFYTFVWFIGAGSCIAVHKGTKNMPKVALGVAILAFVGLCVVSPTSLLVPIRESPKAFLAQGIFAVIYAYVLFFWGGLDFVSIRKTGDNRDFSYSLYIIHFPILLLGLSFSQDWIGRSMSRTAVVSLIMTVATIAIAYRFSRIFERPKYFRDIVFRVAHRRGNVTHQS